MQKRAYLTGGTGCVGRNIIDILLKKGWDITVAYRKSSKIEKLRELKINLVEIDPYDYQSVRKSMPKDLDCVFHVAGNTSHWKMDKKLQHKDNVLFTHNVVRAAMFRRAKRFIFTSTAATRGTKDPLNSSMQYVRSKRMGEIEVENGIKNGLNAIIVQPCIVVGAYDSNNYSQIFNLIKNNKLPGVLSGRFVFCHAKSVAEAHVNAYYHGRSGAKYILGGDVVTWMEFFQVIAKTVGGKCPTKTLPNWMAYAYAYFCCIRSFFTKKRPYITPEIVKLLTMKISEPPDMFAAEKDLKYKSLPISSMVKDCYKWMVKEKLI